MALPGGKHPNPYVGPRAFRLNERLFGRDRETNRLLNLLIAERIVLLYSPSGAGKTSLIQANLIPRLQDKKFHARPVARVNLEPPPALAARPNFNRYVFSALNHFEDALPEDQQISEAELAGLTLADYFARRPGPANGVEALLFDQFEEILTLDPTDQAAKQAFFNQLAELLNDRFRWALFSMREDYIAALDPYTLPIPTRFGNTFRLDLLEESAAREAIQRPAREAGVDFTDPAAKKLVDDLRQVQVQRPDGKLDKQPGPYVEPVQLQVVCYRLWAGLPPSVRQIVEADLESVGDVDRSLADYYAERVRAIAVETGVSERAIREWFDTQLITGQGIRGQVLMEQGQSAGLDNRAIRRLENAHLVRGEQRRGATWFELSHDRLIKPVHDSNAEWFQKNLSVLQRQAALWEGENRPVGLLRLPARDLVEAKRWAAKHASELTPTERDFLNAIEHEGLRARAIGCLMIIATLAALAAFIFGFQSGRNALQARENLNTAQAANTSAFENASTAQAAESTAQADRGTAQAASTEAYVQATNSANSAATAGAAEGTAIVQATNAAQERASALIALSRQLAAQARSYLSSDLDLALLLGVEAYRVFQTAEAESVLRDALDRKASRAAEPLPGRPIPRQNSPIYTVAFSPDGQLLAWGSDDGSVALWDMSTQRQRLLGGHTGRTYTVAFSPDGKILASGGQDGVIILWEVATGQDITSFRRTSNAWALSLTFNPDGLEMVIGHTGSTLSMWNIADSGNPAFVRSLARGHRDDVWSVAWSPDGAQLASGSADGTVRVWDPETGDALLTPEKLHTDIVWSVAWSPDGKWLASGSRDSTIVLWSAATGEPLGPPLKGHTGEVFSVAVSPDGKLLASGSADRSIILWDVSSPEAPKEIIRLQDDHTNSVRTLAFSPVRNETILASGGFDRTIVLRRIIVPPPTDQPLDAQACAAAGRPFTQEEWDLFFPGQAYAPPCKGP